MAYRKRGFKPKRSQRPRVARRKMMRRVKSATFLKIKETFDAGTFGSTSGQALGFSLNSLPQLASYQNLYQKYKITGALLKFIPMNVSNGDYNQALFNVTSGTAPWLGRTRIAYSIARGNMGTPGSELAILQQQHKIRLMGDNIISVYVKNPVFGVDANPGGVTTETKWTTGYLGTSQSADVIHQGIEWYASSTGSSSSSFKVIVTLYVTFTEPN